MLAGKAAADKSILQVVSLLLYDVLYEVKFIEKHCIFYGGTNPTLRTFINL